MIIKNNLNEYFEEFLSDINVSLPETKAYIVGIFNKMQWSLYDLSGSSITLRLAEAKEKSNFINYQSLGDYIFFIQAVAPAYFKAASRDYYDTVGRLSYYSCYRLINKQLKVYEELSDDFIYLQNQVHKKLINIL